MLRKLRAPLQVTLYLVITITLLFVGCKEDSKNGKVKGPTFEEFSSPMINADSVYNYLEDQLAFGHRVPGTDAHKSCKDYLVAQLKNFGAEVQVQEFTSSFFNVKNAPSYNIFASTNPAATKRILIGAHWDSRIVAEKDGDPSMKNKPILGADDGASGTAMILELARVIKENRLSYIGVDFILFDAEDQGIEGEGWCQGSQYWGKNPVPLNYFAAYGVLLDMIGAEGAHFGYEAFSEGQASQVLYKVWDLAEFLGYGDLFTRTKTGPITDDHYYVMAYRGFPMIDIINRPMKTPSGFGHYHHTHKDDISVISKDVLAKVGHVMTQLIYREDQGKI